METLWIEMLCWAKLWYIFTSSDILPVVLGQHHTISTVPFLSLGRITGNKFSVSQPSLFQFYDLILPPVSNCRLHNFDICARVCALACVGKKCLGSQNPGNYPNLYVLFKIIVKFKYIARRNG